jgi:DNA-directed RNA polymerase specialized sigma subunit
VDAYLDVVLKVAQERSDAPLTVGDRFQEGAIGLVIAIDEYARRAPAGQEDDFEAFVTERIRAEVERAQAEDDSATEEARGLVAAAEQFEAAEQEFRREHGRPASQTEVAEALGWTVQRTAEVAEMVAGARTQHDEDLLAYLDPEDVDPAELRRLLEERGEG